MTNSGVKFSDLNKLPFPTDNDYLLANDQSTNTTKSVDIGVLKSHILSALPPGTGEQDLQSVTDKGSETTNKIEAKGGIDVTGNLKVSDILTLESQTALPTGALGDVCQFNKEPYFHDGTEWRRFYLYDSPAAPDAPDPDYNNVLARVTFNTDFLDVSNSPKTITDSDVFIDNSNSKFGGASLKIPSNTLSPYLRYDYTNNDLIIGDFSTEFWLYPSAYSAQEILRHEYRQVAGNTGTVYNVSVNMLGNGTIQFLHNGVQLIITNYALSQNAWNHILLQRDQSTVYLYLNGGFMGSASFNSVMYMEDSEFYGNNIWIDDFRLTKDIRYTDTNGQIQVPTVQLPTSA